MRKKLMMFVAAFCLLQMQVNASSIVGDTAEVIMRRCAMENDKNNIGYDNNCVIVSTWHDNWFVSLSGGVNAFVGKPLGCEDLFGRIKPSIGLAVGKWITPSIGGRLYYQGLQFKDCNLATQDYQHLHADLLWNVLGDRYGKNGGARLAIVPFIGVGLLHNKSNGQKPFVLRIISQNMIFADVKWLTHYPLLYNSCVSFWHWIVQQSVADKVHQSVRGHSCTIVGKQARMLFDKGYDIIQLPAWRLKAALSICRNYVFVSSDASSVTVRSHV